MLNIVYNAERCILEDEKYIMGLRLGLQRFFEFMKQYPC